VHESIRPEEFAALSTASRQSEAAELDTLAHKSATPRDGRTSRRSSTAGRRVSWSARQEEVLEIKSMKEQLQLISDTESPC